MTKSVLLLAFALFATTTLAAVVNPDCLSYNHSVLALFEIDSLYNNSTNYEVNSTAGLIRYNFCGQFFGSNSSYNTSATIETSDNTTSRLTIGTIPKFLPQNTSNPLGGIYLVYPAGDPVPGSNTSNKTYNYTVALSCANGENFSSSNTTADVTDGYNVTLYAIGKQGCPVLAYYQLANFVTKYKVIFIIAGIVIGVFVGFFGLRLFRPTLFLTGFVTVSLLMAFVLFVFALGNSPSAGAQWGCLVGALAIGVLAGVLLVKLEKVGIFFLGASLGTAGSFLLYTLIIHHFGAGKVVIALFTVGSALICGIVALLVFEHVIIIATALGGAYLAIRGLSLFAPPKYAYPNEIAIAKEIQYNGLSNVPVIFYAYFSVIVVLAAVGAFIQYRHKRSRDEEKAQENSYQGLAYQDFAYHAHP
jgi:hypothetical protein